MNRSRIIFYGMGVVVFALVALSAWTYVDRSAQEDGATAGPIGPNETIPEDHPDVTETTAPRTASPAPTGGDADAGPDLGTPTSMDAGDYTRSDATGGNVTVDAAVLTAGALALDETLAPLVEQLAPDEFGILLAFNTHSVDLSEYDPVAKGSLAGPEGEVQPVRWVTESDGSHHRSGVVVFPADGVEPVSPGELTLTLRDLDGVPERVMTWSLPLE